LNSGAAAAGAAIALCVRYPQLCKSAAQAAGAAIGSSFCAITGLCNESAEDDDSPKQCDTSGSQDKKLSKGEIKKLKDGGVDPHDLKDNSKQDLFKDKDGNIFIKPKSGIGPGDPTGQNINDF